MRTVYRFSTETNVIWMASNKRALPFEIHRHDFCNTRSLEYTSEVSHCASELQIDFSSYFGYNIESFNHRNSGKKCSTYQHV